MGIARLTIVVIVFASALFAAQRSAHEKEVWSLEDAYWQYVKTNDFEPYRALWHADFLGWPYSSPEPAGKEQTTEWITAHTSKGEILKSYKLERLKAQVTGAYATVTYRVHLIWTDKDGTDKPGSLRIIHTWLHDASGKWQIISGMGAPTDAQGH